MADTSSTSLFRLLLCCAFSLFVLARLHSFLRRTDIRYPVNLQVSMELLLLSALLFWSRVCAVPTPAHESGGAEHIVIIDNAHPTSPAVAEVLQRLALHEGHSDVYHVFNNSAFTGFAASMKSHCLDLLANMSDVAMVEQATTVARADVSLAYDTRPDAPWGLQRISTAAAVGGSAQAMDFTYAFANPALGNNADVYVVDTGIWAAHNVFGGRAQAAWTFDNDTVDHDGHGTHVAGTAGGGVASNANILGVKALDADGGGWSSNVVAGIDFVIRNHDARKADGSNFTGSVMSMSLASGATVQAIDSAIRAASQAGVHTVVAAGNANEDACLSTPGSSGGTEGPAIVVGAVGMTSQRSSFSNFGDCVDVYAPGENIISAWPGKGNNLVNSLSGTSMATPHVTGIVAYAMGNKTLAGDVGLMKEWVQMTALRVGELKVANNGVKRVDGGNEEGMLGRVKGASSRRRARRWLRAVGRNWRGQDEGVRGLISAMPA